MKYLQTREIDDIIAGKRNVGVPVFTEVPDEDIPSNSTHIESASDNTTQTEL